MVTKIKPYRIRDVNEPEEGNSLQYNDPNTFVRGEGEGGGGEYTAGEGISIGQGLDYSAMRGPCDEGFHIPTRDEAQFLLTISQRSDSQLPGTLVKAPNNGFIKFQNPNIYASWTRWTCTASGNTGEDHHTNAYMLCYDNSGYTPSQPLAPTDKSYGCGVRAFKDNPVIPDETWTILGQNQRGAFYWNETLGLITAHNTDNNQYVTLQDKNVGATNVGDNGLYFQWGNNQGFTSASAATSTTKVDASGYEPSTYAADPINTGYDWSSEENDNLWGGVTGAVTIENVITNTGVLSVNGETGHVTVASPDMSNYLAKNNTTAFTPTGDYNPATKKYVDDNDTYIGTSAPTNNVIEGRLWYDTTADVLKVYDGSAWVPTGKTYTAGSHINISNADVISTVGLQEELAVGDNITIQDECHRNDRGPCPDGFHVPSSRDWTSLRSLTNLGLTVSEIMDYLKIPRGRYLNVNGSPNSNGYYRTNAVFSQRSEDARYCMPDSLNTGNGMYNNSALPIRPWKDISVQPDNTWTTLYDGSSIAAGAGIFHNTTEGLISASADGTNWVTIADKNLGATTVRNVGDTQDGANYGSFFQWGNNYGFPWSGPTITSSTKVDTSSYSPSNQYSSSTFVSGYIGGWQVSVNRNIRGGENPSGTRCQPKISATDTTYTAGNGINIDANNEISVDTTVVATQTDLNSKQDELIAGDNITIGDAYTTESDMKGPAPDGFHVPLITEWEGLKTIMDGLSLTTGTDWRENLRIPSAGMRNRTDAATGGAGGLGSYWSSSPMSSPDNAHYLYISGADVSLIYEGTRTFGYSIRCFKDSYVVPTSSWTVVQGTLGSAGIFRNQTEGLISITSDGTTGYTIADKNLGATTVWNNGDTLSEANCGKYYQRGNNYGFPFTGNVSTSSTQVDTTGYGPGNYYTGADFIVGIPGSTYDWSNPSNDNLRGGVTQGTWQDCIHNVISATDTTYTAGTGIAIDSNNVISNALPGAIVSATVPSSPTEGMVWYDTTNDVLKNYDGTNWNIVGREYNAGLGITIGTIVDYSAMRGPCASGYHVPTSTEWANVKTVWTTLGGGATDGANFGITLKMPFAGMRYCEDGGLSMQGTVGYYYSCSCKIALSTLSIMAIMTSTLNEDGLLSAANAATVRPFKDEPVVPTLSWTKLYGTSIEAGGIFWSSADGLISLSSDGTTWITIADKNLGATTVWNSGDTLSEANCGKYYQWGNNYAFPWSGILSDTSTTQVDATGYGPGNYYYDDTFITVYGNWDSSNNRNLWGGETGAIITNDAISNTGVLSVNGETGDVLVNDTKVSSTEPTSPVEGMLWYDTTNDVLKTYDGTNWNVVGDDAADINTKTFYLSSPSDLTNAQAAYDWFAAGKNPIIIYDNKTYSLYEKTSSYIKFVSTQPGTSDVSNGTSYEYLYGRKFNLNSSTVASIETSNVVLTSNYLRTGFDYPTPYTPQYNGSPATKKYVDDAIAGVDTGVTSVNGDTGAVTLKTINNTAINGNGNISVQTPLSNITASEIQTGTATTQRTITAAVIKASLLRIDPNSPVKPKYIWIGTQAQYEALSSTDSTTLYFTTDA